MDIQSESSAEHDQIGRWLSQRSHARVRNTAASDPDESLVMATTIADRGILRTLSEARQSNALREIALAAGTALRNPAAHDDAKLAFVSRIGGLLSEPHLPLSIDATLMFWEVLLTPDTETRTTSAVQGAIMAALAEQLGSPDNLVRWSAARGVASLVPASAAQFRVRNRDLFADETVRALAFPRMVLRRSSHLRN